ncbi:MULTISPECIES: DUF4180 domain-containing protein [unclassified Streptomyces]|uniref:DUF4180 domain-containing protein n=1 Tax=unclassified Streptomyces TaxID=2593676 RepID=UPI001BE5D0BF|nr:MULTISPECIES: DUF4180 domain-containing protein [unclassified Streptomyces]MBT2404445.1 DUF4180 domain-containing protein [Streptomyces sp. ISL-21]MBT2457718.1 DUF4180 domain-containing protein [Streptomyces sp. ISL-86]MBT2612501.1 DUF4180 domain-containing protein [Streptomyces sp. ISL-87]
MTDLLQERRGVQVLMCDPKGPTVVTEQDALDLIGAALFDAEVVVVPVSRFDEKFFSLSTGFAGDIMQKFVNYRLRLAVIGDISRHMETSTALRALVHESNTASHIWFLPDVESLDARLEAAGAKGRG